MTQEEFVSKVIRHLEMMPAPRDVLEYPRLREQIARLYSDWWTVYDAARRMYLTSNTLDEDMAIAQQNILTAKYSKHVQPR